MDSINQTGIKVYQSVNGNFCLQTKQKKVMLMKTLMKAP